MSNKFGLQKSKRSKSREGTKSLITSEGEGTGTLRFRAFTKLSIPSGSTRTLYTVFPKSIVAISTHTSTINQKLISFQAR